MSRPHRSWLQLPQGKELQKQGVKFSKRKERFTFVTYNILAQALVRRDMFPVSTQKALRWKHRRQNLLQEFLDLSPDLACLQEVDFWTDHYLPSLTRSGYDGVYFKHATKKHGCAIVWKRNRFERTIMKTTDSEPGQPQQEEQEHVMVEQRIEYDSVGQPTFLTGNVALMIGLRPIRKEEAESNADPNADMVQKDDEEEKDPHDDGDVHGEDQAAGILVVTTHLFWRPDGSYERLRQASILMEKVQQFNASLGYTVLMGGDFNTTPKDAAYRVMTRNQMPEEQIPNLEKWLTTEIAKLQEELRLKQLEAEQKQKREQEQEQEQKEKEKETANSSNSKDTDSMKVLTAQTSGLTVDGEPLPTAAGRAYPAPPTGMTLASLASSSSSSPSKGEATTNAGTNTSATTKVKEDAPVFAPFEAFTPPHELVLQLHSLPRCISIYGQYQSLLKSAGILGRDTDENGVIPTQSTQADQVEALKHEYTNLDTVKENHGEPHFTNFAPWFKATLDYIYLLEENQKKMEKKKIELVPLSLLDIPDHRLFGAPALPSEILSSDHVPLAVQFGMRF